MPDDSIVPPEGQTSFSGIPSAHFIGKLVVLWTPILLFTATPGLNFDGTFVNLKLIDVQPINFLESYEDQN